MPALMAPLGSPAFIIVTSVYARLAPRPDIAPWVESIWIQEDDRDARHHAFAPTRVLPTGRTDLILHYRERFMERRRGVERLLPAVAVCGPWTAPAESWATGRTGLVIVRFRPWGLAAFLRQPTHALADRAVDLAELIAPQEARALEQRAHEAPGLHERVQAVTAHLARRLAGARSDPVVEEAVGRIVASGGTLSMGWLAEELGLSRRQLARRFRARVGLGPKRLSEVVRFQRAVQLRRSGLQGSAAAARCGFSDQSHMLRSFKAFAGLSFERFPLASETGPGRYYNGTGASHSSYTIYA